MPYNIFMPIIPILIRIALSLLIALLSGAGAATAATKLRDRKKAKEAAARKKIQDDATARAYKDLD